MPYDPHIHHRRSIRLRGYDYAQAGAYFVTVCVQGKECLLGQIADGQMKMSGYGETVARCWNDLPNNHPSVQQGRN